jgi:hypothetical protein
MLPYRTDFAGLLLATVTLLVGGPPAARASDPDGSAASRSDSMPARVRALTNQRPTVEPGMSRIFHLRDGNVISGTVSSITPTGEAIIETSDGSLRVPVGEVLDEIADLVKHDGTRFTGPILTEDAFSIALRTPYGIVTVLKQEIRTMDRYYGEQRVSWAEDRRRFFAGEQITDVFLDPTAFTLPPNVAYVSGLSLGYGFSERFSLRTRFGNDLVGDLNLHPLFRIMSRSTGTGEMALSVGAGLFNRHSVLSETMRYTHWIHASDGRSLDEDDAPLLAEALMDPTEESFFWDTYLVLSWREALASGRGKWGWHLGAKTNSFALEKPSLAEGYEWNLDVPYRVWAGMDYDLTKRLKFLIEVWADNGHKFVRPKDVIETYTDFDNTPFALETEKGDYRPVDLDFGFTYGVTDALRLGVHFQAPFATVYWKFREW